MNKPCKDHGKRGNKKGYGMVRHAGKSELQHRVVYCQHNGIDIQQIKGMVVRHSCDNARCIEPSHLLLGTHADNVRDMMERGRHRYVPFTHRPGISNPNAKLDYHKAKAIRQAYRYGVHQKDLARQFEVSQALVSLVINNKIWDEAVGEVNIRIAPLSITADGLAELGFTPVATEKAAKLYRESDYPRICEALIQHLTQVADVQVAA